MGLLLRVQDLLLYCPCQVSTALSWGLERHYLKMRGSRTVWPGSEGKRAVPVVWVRQVPLRVLIPTWRGCWENEYKDVM